MKRAGTTLEEYEGKISRQTTENNDKKIRGRAESPKPKEVSLKSMN
jgi:hypothetical protein